MICSIINFSQLEDRIDVEYYKQEYFRAESVLSKSGIGTVTIGEIASEIRYGTSEDLPYLPSGVPLLRVTDVNEIFTIDPQESKFISERNAERLKSYRVKEGDVLISRTGTLGLAVYIGKRLKNSVYGSYFIKVSIKDERLEPQFVAIFLNSRFGKLQSSRRGSGGIQTNLTIDAIKSITIPVFPKFAQQRIIKLVQQSFGLRQESKALIEEAKREVEEMIEKAGE